MNFYFMKHYYFSSNFHKFVVKFMGTLLTLKQSNEKYWLQILTNNYCTSKKMAKFCGHARTFTKKYHIISYQYKQLIMNLHNFFQNLYFSRESRNFIIIKYLTKTINYNNNYSQNAKQELILYCVMYLWITIYAVTKENR